MNLLNHVAIIMDGNGRWGLKKKKSRNFGHLQGLQTIEKIINKTLILKIPYLTLYTLSIENWKRPKSEISFLFTQLERYFKKNIEKLIERNIKIIVIGEKKKLPKRVKKILIDAEAKTKKIASWQSHSKKKTGNTKLVMVETKKPTKTTKATKPTKPTKPKKASPLKK